MKNCPFCGSNQINEFYHFGDASMVCQDCWAEGPTFSYWKGDNRDKAIEKAKTAWNTRDATL